MKSTRFISLRTAGVAGALIAGTLALSGFAAAQSPSRHNIPGDDISIYNLIGTATVVAGTGADVSIEVNLTGRDAAKLAVEAGVHDGRPMLRVIFPGSKFVDKSMGLGSITQMRVEKDGTFGNSVAGGRSVKISGRGSGLEARADLTISVPAGKTVRVHQAVGEVSATGVDANLIIDTAAASVSAAKIRGSLSVGVGSGDVDITDVRGERVHVDTGSGQVTGSEISAPTLTIDTGSGDIDLTAVSTVTVHLDTGSGSVSIELVSDVEELAIDTGSGDVRVGIPESLGAGVRVETGSGDIEIDVSHETEKLRRSFFRGRIGDGLGEIRIDTGSGAVSLVES